MDNLFATPFGLPQGYTATGSDSDLSLVRADADPDLAAVFQSRFSQYLGQ